MYYFLAQKNHKVRYWRRMGAIQTESFGTFVSMAADPIV